MEWEWFVSFYRLASAWISLSTVHGGVERARKVRFGGNDDVDTFSDWIRVFEFN